MLARLHAMASDPAPLAQDEHRSGDVIAGRYVLRQKLGEGGMGVVWAARSNALDVDVALKMLRRELAGTPAVERMAREARTAAQLGHPALVRMLDFGTSELGEPFLVMELLQGEELHHRLAREQRIPAERAVALLLPIIDGLGTAHDKGIIHRDIKPENIFLVSDAQGRVQPKVLDFGIAKLGYEDAPSKLTQVGAVMGSPYYLSPEQAEGLDDIDFRCDIWSVGVVLYELVNGSPPFVASNYNALIRSILNDTPTPLTALSASNAGLWVVVERCLRKNREERWSSMWELGEALALWLFERGVRVDASARSLRHGWLDGGLTGLQILVSSDPPDPPTLPPAPLLVVKDSALLASTVVRVRAHPRQRWRFGVLLAAVAAGVCGAALVFAWLRIVRAPQSPSVGKPSVSAGAEVSRPAAVSGAVVALGSSTPPAPVASITAAEASALPTEPLVASSARSSTPHAAAPRALPAPVRRPRAVTRARPKTEFGF
jgi:serine/threonine protein kinase